MSCVNTYLLAPLIRKLPPIKFNPSDPRPHIGIDQTAIFVKCGHDPSVAGKLVFAADAKAAVPKGFDQFSLTSLSDLPVASIEPLADEAALAQAFAARAAHITPFALCEAAECVIFVDCEKDPSLGDGFFYLEQRDAAVAGYSVPYRLLPALAEHVLSASATRVDLSQCVWLHSTGRCGSTLLSKVLAAMGGVQSLSEPDFYSDLRRIHTRAAAGTLPPVVRPGPNSTLHVLALALSLALSLALNLALTLTLTLALALTLALTLTLTRCARARCCCCTHSD